MWRYTGIHPCDGGDRVDTQRIRTVTSFECIGVLAHPLRPHSFPLAQQIANWLEDQGIQTRLYTEWTAEQVQGDIIQTDVVVAIGGDGAMLRAARVCAPHKVPVLGINAGQLGFLTEVGGPEHWQSSLQAMLDGAYWVENRAMLRAVVMRDGYEPIPVEHALNEFVVSGSVIGRMMQMDMFIDDEWTTTYHADALVIASATGSTAYALALKGPILPPELDNILVVPAAPHLSVDRAIVLPQGARVDVVVRASTVDAVISGDGAIVHELQPGDKVRVQTSEYVTRFIRLGSRNYFYRSLLDRLEPRVQRDRHQNT